MELPKTEPICGQVAKVEKKDGKKAPWFIVDIICHVHIYNDVYEEMVYSVKAFGKVADKCSSLRDGDHVTVIAHARSKTWQGKHYAEYSMHSLEVNENAVPPADVAEGVQASEQTDGGSSDNLPF